MIITTERSLRISEIRILLCQGAGGSVDTTGMGQT